MQKRIAELERENEQLRSHNVQLRAENDAQQALLQEQELAAQERYSELTKVIEQAVKLENVNAIMRDSVRQLSNEADLETFLGYVITQIAEQIEANYITLFRYDESNHTLTLHLSYSNGNLRQGTSGDELELFAAPFRADITVMQKLIEDRELLEEGIAYAAGQKVQL